MCIRLSLDGFSRKRKRIKFECYVRASPGAYA